MDVIGHGVAVDLGGAAFLRTDATGVVAEVVGGQRDVGVEGFAHGLAVVPGFGDCQDFQVLFDAVGDFQQHQRARLDGRRAPGICSGVGSVQGFIDVFGRGTREFGNGLAIYWRSVGEVLTFDRRDELAADVVTVFALERNDSAFSTGVSVTHEIFSLAFVLIRERACALVISVEQRSGHCAAAQVNQGLARFLSDRRVRPVTLSVQPL
ncbi:hypothetical protein PS833_05850 [Pseudomonas fluorescens]|uniref:Uncharacterized protein n=1 Tax=Pseudomonas fluorescens TaxID=294 RepID=A0A5E7FNG8_PSEFL|nr:hypothetical protein PS833_05850 [Pseudomonas fluorescens]